MTSAVEITMTRRGFEVTFGTRTTVFPEIERALDFAHARLEHARSVRDISRRCE
jgi:hypothetical protein